MRRCRVFYFVCLLLLPVQQLAAQDAPFRNEIYAPGIIYLYQPKQVVIYCGENDLAASDTVTAPTVFNRFRELFTGIRKHVPGVSVAFVSIKPSPSRRSMFSKMEQTNQLIKDFLAQQPQTAFIDVYPLMMQDGKPDTTLFLGDQLHMNEKGYAIWKKAIGPYLKK